MKRHQNFNQDDQDYEDDSYQKSYIRGQNQPIKKTAEEERIEKRIELDPYDTEAWAILLQEPAAMDSAVAKKTFEKCLSIFPTAAHYWEEYIKFLMKYGDKTEIETAFDRCLAKIPNVDLWRVYLEYLKGKFSSALSPASGANMSASGMYNPMMQTTALDTMKKAYESALDHVGYNMSSVNIWMEYLQILKRLKTSSSAHAVLSPQDVAYIRSIFHKALTNPMYELEKIMSDYEAFEQSYCTDPLQAKQNINDMQGKFRATCNRLRAKKNVYDGLLVNMLARPPRNSEKELQQKHLWKKCVSFEMQVTFGLEQEEIRARVTFAYNQALLCLYHHADVWIDAANYQIKVGDLNMALQFYMRGMEALPKNLLIFFSYIEFEEKIRKNYEICKKFFEKFLSAENAKNLEKSEKTLVLIHYSRFLRRNNFLSEARKLVLTSKDSATYHLFVSAALDEFHDSNQDFGKRVHVATQIFKYGLGFCLNEPNFILEYLKFFEQINDKNNMRLLFEKVISQNSAPSLTQNQDKIQNFLTKNAAKTTPANSIEIWNRFLNFEYSENSAENAENLEKRKIEKFGASFGERNSKFNSLIFRLKFMDLWPCKNQDFDLIPTIYNAEFSDFSAPLGTGAGASSNFQNLAILTQSSNSNQKNEDIFSKKSKFSQESLSGNANSILNNLNANLINYFQNSTSPTKISNLFSKKIEISKPEISKWQVLNPNSMSLNTGNFSSTNYQNFASNSQNEQFIPPAISSLIQFLHHLPVYTELYPELEYVLDTIKNCPIQVPLNLIQNNQPGAQNNLVQNSEQGEKKTDQNVLKRTRDQMQGSSSNLNPEENEDKVQIIDDIYRERRLKKKKIA